jgi:2-oxoglutarate dehydrogenase E2 component (dihydrolipoamide succinyltransferase)
MADITMPQLGETVTEGTITRWLKQVGDTVALDEPLVEVSTDKVDSEVPSPVAGVVSEILVQEGDTVDVGTLLARIGDAGSAPAPAPAPAAEPAPAPEPEPAPAPAAAPAPAPAAPAPEPAPVPAAAASSSNGGDSRLLSPVVRRLISENGLDPSTIEGTGAGGRITRADVEGVIKTRGPMPAPAAPAAPASAPAAAAEPTRAPAPAVSVTATGRDEVVPFSNIRRRTAEHMVRSKATSAHALTAVEVDYHNVERVRVPNKDTFKQEEGVTLTYLPFISRAVVDALRDFPELNASVGHDELIIHHDINLGYAVDLEFKGLMVPVVQNADGKRLRALAREVADLAERARSKQLGPDDISGGTFTITNIGSYGTTITFPVINQPQIAILSTDGVRKRPVVIEQADGTDAIVVHPVGWRALAWDHRAVDGAYAAAFLRKVKDILETRDWESELA